MVSTSTDGKILVWEEEAKLAYPLKGYLMARKKKQELRIVGGTCLSVACDDNETFIVGTESGSLFKCKVAVPNVVFG